MWTGINTKVHAEDLWNEMMELMRRVVDHEWSCSHSYVAYVIFILLYLYQQVDHQ